MPGGYALSVAPDPKRVATAADEASGSNVAAGEGRSVGEDGALHARAFHASNALACVRHRSLSGAGDVVQLVQMGASQVPLLFFGVFQSQISVAGRPHAHRCRRRVPQTIADPPPGRVTCVQGMLAQAPIWQARAPGCCVHNSALPIEEREHGEAKQSGTYEAERDPHQDPENHLPGAFVVSKRLRSSRSRSAA